MNKNYRKSPPGLPFPKVDKSAGHEKGSIAGNMMGYGSKSEPETRHVKGSMPGNMMGYPAAKSPKGYPPIANESQNYGPRPKSNPTSIVENSDKAKPEQMKGYYGITPNKTEWTTVKSQLKKKGSFYG